MRVKNYQNSQLRYQYIKCKKYSRLFIVEKAIISDLLNEALNKLRGKKVLDVGCGEAEYGGNFSFYVGIDPSERIFNAKKGENRIYIRAIAEDLPLTNDNFDVCLLLATLDHLGYPEAALEEIKHALKPHGHLLIILGNSLSLRNRLARTIRHRTWDLRHIHFFSTRDVSDILEKAGFKIVVLKSVGYLIIPPAIQNLFPFKILRTLSCVANKVFSIVLPYNSSYFLMESLLE